MTIDQQLKELITQHKIVLFMKGTPTFPQCGFSGKVVQILKSLDAEFTGINVLENNEIREGIKQYSNWPTLPQLYINGEFIGGCDIVTHLYEQGELQKLIA